MQTRQVFFLCDGGSVLVNKKKEALDPSSCEVFDLGKGWRQISQLADHVILANYDSLKNTDRYTLMWFNFAPHRARVVNGEIAGSVRHLIAAHCRNRRFSLRAAAIYVVLDSRGRPDKFHSLEEEQLVWKDPEPGTYEELTFNIICDLDRKGFRPKI